VIRIQFAGGDPVEDVGDVGQLVFGQEADLQIKVRSLAGLCGHPVLRDQLSFC
jgi:hypothetical protein